VAIDQLIAVVVHAARLPGESISVAGACTRFGHASNESDFDTDQSRSVYLGTLDRFCKFDLARHGFKGLMRMTLLLRS
jgi:hypothetical protein